MSHEHTVWLSWGQESEPLSTVGWSLQTETTPYRLRYGSLAVCGLQNLGERIVDECRLDSQSLSIAFTPTVVVTPRACRRLPELPGRQHLYTKANLWRPRRAGPGLKFRAGSAEMSTTTSLPGPGTTRTYPGRKGCRQLQAVE